jgi:hypothetical protein
LDRPKKGYQNHNREYHPRSINKELDGVQLFKSRFTTVSETHHWGGHNKVEFQ